MENEEGGAADEPEADQMIPLDRLAEISPRKDAEDDQRDDLLDGLQLCRRIIAAAVAIGRHRQTIFEEGDAPADDDDQKKRGGFEFEVSIPGESLENVRHRQHADRQESLHSENSGERGGAGQLAGVTVSGPD